MSPFSKYKQFYFLLNQYLTSKTLNSEIPSKNTELQYDTRTESNKTIKYKIMNNTVDNNDIYISEKKWHSKKQHQTN